MFTDNFKAYESCRNNIFVERIIVLTETLQTFEILSLCPFVCQSTGSTHHGDLDRSKNLIISSIRLWPLNTANMPEIEGRLSVKG